MLQFPIVKPHSLCYLCCPVWLSFSFPWPAYMRYTHLSFKTHPTLEQCAPTQAHTHNIDLDMYSNKAVSDQNCVCPLIAGFWNHDRSGCNWQAGWFCVPPPQSLRCPPSRLLPRRTLSISTVLKCQKHVLARIEGRAGIKRKPNRTRE